MFKPKNIFIVLLITLLLVSVSPVLAQDYYSVAKNGDSQKIDKHGECRIVTNDRSDYDIFVPVKTDAEWLEFRINYPTNVVLDDCVTDIIVWVSSSAYDCDLGGRSGADSKCIDDKPSEISCKTGTLRAFLSLSSTDEIRDMPDNYGFDTSLPIYWYNKSTNEKTTLATNWADMLDSSIANTQAAGTGISEYSWCPCLADGSLSDLDLCTDSCYMGTGSETKKNLGLYDSDTGSWLQGACTTGGTKRLRCICQE